MVNEGKISVKLVRSPIGKPAKVKAWVAGLGLKRPNQTVTLQDTPEIRGMLAKVPHMVEWSVSDTKKTVRKKKTQTRKTTGSKGAEAEASPKAEEDSGVVKEMKEDAKPAESGSGV